MYFKGALFIHTLRSLVDDDAKWWPLVRAFYQRFKYQNITTDQVIAFFNEKTGKNLTPIFDQYLRFTELPTLDLAFQDGGQVAYRWHADVPGFAMPIKVGAKGAVAAHPAHDRLAGHDHAALEGGVRGGDGPLLRQRRQAVVDINR